MTQHTPIVEAYVRMIQLQENSLYAAALNNRSRALKHEDDARAWNNAGDLLIDEASEDEQLIMQAIYRESQVLPLREKVREMRQSKNEAAEPARPTAPETIFAGLVFAGPAVSFEEYTKHYDEYRKRCSAATNEEAIECTHSTTRSFIPEDSSGKLQSSNDSGRESLF